LAGGLPETSVRKMPSEFAPGCMEDGNRRGEDQIHSLPPWFPLKRLNLTPRNKGLVLRLWANRRPISIR
jgi:hypothetical protein